MKSFDRAYFDKWYRHPGYRIGTRADLARQIHLAVAAAEYVLMRPIRSVLDVGAGEGRWQPVLHTLRPRARYTGVDPSEYVIHRYGARRNIVRGTFDDLDTLFPTRTFDLVVCCSVLNYLPPDACQRAIHQLSARTHGVAFLEIFTADDAVVGDTDAWHAESPRTYRQWLTRAGLTPCGMHCYVSRSAAASASALELFPR
jgi:SAM-dependent methyltransferase